MANGVSQKVCGLCVCVDRIVVVRLLSVEGNVDIDKIILVDFPFVPIGSLCGHWLSLEYMQIGLGGWAAKPGQKGGAGGLARG